MKFRFLRRFLFRRPKAIKVAYLIESTMLYGGIKVAFRHVQALEQMGCHATIICHEPYPDWLEPGVNFTQADPFNQDIGNSFDVLVATSARLPAQHYPPLGKAVVFHLMQGYEGDLKEAAPYMDIILKCYNLRMPSLAVTPYLKDLLEDRFDNEVVHYIGQGIDHHYFYPARPNKNLRYTGHVNLFVFGNLQQEVKQIRLALRVFSQAKAVIPQLRLIRISIFDTKREEEEILGHDIEFAKGKSPLEVGQILRQNPGILLGPSQEAEGFGLPPLEAMACGVPTVITRTPGFLSFDDRHDYALFSEVGNAEEMVEGIVKVFRDDALRAKIIKRGLEVAGNFTHQKVAKNLKKVFEEYLRK